MRMPRLVGALFALIVLALGLALLRAGALDLAPAIFLGAGAGGLLAISPKDAATPQARMLVVQVWAAASALFASAALAAFFSHDGMTVILVGGMLAALGAAGTAWSFRQSRRRRRNAIFDGYLTR